MTRKFEQSMGLRARSHPSAKQGSCERSLVALLKSRGPLQLIEAVTPLPTRRGFISDGAIRCKPLRSKWIRVTVDSVGAKHVTPGVTICSQLLSRTNSAGMGRGRARQQRHA